MSVSESDSGQGVNVSPPDGGRVLIAYDGSDLAKRSISEAGGLLESGLSAVIVCVWRPFDVGFTPVDTEEPFNAEEISAVRAAAERTAEAGASLAREHGFVAYGLAVESPNIPDALMKAAEEHDASVIVLGSRGRGRLVGALLGSVADRLMNRCPRTLLVVHARD